MTRKFPTRTTVASFIAGRLAACGKTQREIAEECGFEQPNIITMFKNGSTKVPLNRIGALAKALDADPPYMLRLAMQEYMPDTWKSIEETLNGTILTANELKMIQDYRAVTFDSDSRAIVFKSRCPGCGRYLLD